MCGIVAILKAHDLSFAASCVDAMRDEITYRGPDDCGTIRFAPAGATLRPVAGEGSDWTVALGNRRLKILDLSASGHQPMSYRDRFWITYNGEVYNYIELRSELQKLGHQFHSTSDTEVVLAAFAQWGPECFRRLRGMWALVIADLGRRQVFLCRDRLGMKPMYLWRGPGVVAIASEIKQFCRAPGFQAKVDAATAAEYLQTGYEDQRHSFFEGVTPLPPGTWTSISLDDLRSERSESYWNPEAAVTEIRDEHEAAAQFSEKLRRSVSLHLRSDVPVGCALSGGLDSSTIAALVHEIAPQTGAELHTFSVRFPGEPEDESQYIEHVRAQINAQSHFTNPTAEQFVQDLRRFVWIHDEPVGHLSIYAAYCLARLVHDQGIRVSLNGQGGDEILGGYWQSYMLYLRELARAPHPLRLSANILGALFPGGNPMLLKQLPVMLRRYLKRTNAQFPLLFSANGEHRGSTILAKALSLSGAERRLHEIREMFLPRLLRYEDRNTMAFSVEGRYPYLDHELIEFCLSLSSSVLYKRGWVKWPMRLGLQGVLPAAIARRRSKFGFEVPQRKWLCGPLRPLLERWLESERPIWNLVERAEVRGLAQQVWGVAGHAEWHQQLFRLFIFDRWLEVYDLALPGKDGVPSDAAETAA